MASTPLILNDPRYGTERSYNGLRLARSLLDKGVGQVRVFLMGDAAACDRSGRAGPLARPRPRDLRG